MVARNACIQHHRVYPDGRGDVLPPVPERARSEADAVPLRAAFTSRDHVISWLRVSRPLRLARRVRHARIEPPRGLPIPHRLRAADLRREIAEQRQLLHLPEVMPGPALG